MAGGQGGADQNGDLGGSGGDSYDGVPGSPGTSGTTYGGGGGGGGADGGPGGAGGGTGANAGGAGGSNGVANSLDGEAGSDGTNGGGGGGGQGGVNAFIATSINNATVLTGGAGGAGGNPGSTAGNGGFGGGGGGGGAGGYGSVASGSGIFGALLSSSNTSAITGGAGGSGSVQSGRIPQEGGAGGDGGIGSFFAGSNVAFTNGVGGTLLGGAGGNGGGGSIPGAAGIGGAGASFAGIGSTFINNSTVTGGAGGAGGSSFGGSNNTPVSNGGPGGAGGNGVTGSGLNVVNTGSITGGDGGRGDPGSGLQGSAAGAGGLGGAGISGPNLAITNTGTISGGFANGGSGARADAIDFTQGTNSLTLGNAATQGTLNGGIGVGGTLSVDPGTGAGTSRTLANQIQDYNGVSGSLNKTGVGTLSLTGANTYTGGTTISGGTLNLNAAPGYNNNVLSSGVAGTGAITFASMSGNATARLVVETSAQPPNGGTFSNTLNNFNTSSQLDLTGLTNSQVSYNSANSSITVTGTRGNGQVSENFVLNAPRATNFVAQSDGAGGTRITVSDQPPTQPTNPAPPANNAPCYCTGTRILTDCGEVAVEVLAIGDVVVTAAGKRRPIRWIGSRSYIGRFANTNPAVLPVCMKAGALADGIPSRDLWVSPDHAFYLDGVLIPAEYLVNGTTIVKADRVDSVTYWHIELDSHDVLLAEGAPAESFVDDGGRAIFHNAASYRALYPHQTAWPVAAIYCAERVTNGYALEAVRRRLALRAGLPVAPARVFGELIGHLDLCDGLRVSGWAQDLAHPDGPVCLDIVVDGAVIALAYAETYRADLEAAGIGDGCHAFDLELQVALADEIAHTVEVRRSADGAVIGSLRIEPAIAVAS